MRWECALGDNFTRFFALTNHGKHKINKDMQLAAIIHRHTTVAELCYHAKLNSTLRQGSNTVDQTAVELEDRSTTVKLTG